MVSVSTLEIEGALEMEHGCFSGVPVTFWNFLNTGWRIGPSRESAPENLANNLVHRPQSGAWKRSAYRERDGTYELSETGKETHASLALTQMPTASWRLAVAAKETFGKSEAPTVGPCLSAP